MWGCWPPSQGKLPATDHFRRFCASAPHPAAQPRYCHFIAGQGGMGTWGQSAWRTEPALLWGLAVCSLNTSSLCEPECTSLSLALGTSPVIWLSHFLLLSWDRALRIPLSLLKHHAVFFFFGFVSVGFTFCLDLLTLPQFMNADRLSFQY